MSFFFAPTDFWSEFLGLESLGVSPANSHDTNSPTGGVEAMGIPNLHYLGGIYGKQLGF